MINVLICDDDIAVVEKVQSLLCEIKEQNNIEFNIDTKNDGDFSFEKSSVYDIAIIDVEMPNVNGLTVAENLKRNNPDVIVIVLTSFSDYLDSAMRISVFRYLSKPIDEDRFKRNFLEAVEHFKLTSKQIVIEHKSAVYSIKTKDILYIENLKHGSKIVTKTTEYKTSKKPQELAEIINQNDRFVFSHKSFIVNLQNVVDFDKSTITFTQKNSPLKVACISQRKYNEFKKSFYSFIGG